VAKQGAGASTLRVGVVGCGKIAETHLPYIRKAGGEIVGIADLSSVQANDLADRFGVQRIYRTARELLDTERPDVVHVLTPPHTHAAVAVETLERGVHTLIEKPMAIDVDEAEAIAKAARASGALLTVDHNRLFDPVMLEARRLRDEGHLGEIVAIESYQSGHASERNWLDHLPGRGLGDLLPHPLYLQLAFLGPVRELRAHAFRIETEPGGEELRVMMEGDGRTGALTISTNARPHLNTLKLYGTRMTVEVNLNNMTILKHREYKAPKVVAKSLPNLDDAYQLVSHTARNTVDFVRGRVRYYPGMGTLIQRFYQAIRTGEAPPVSLDEALDVVRVTDWIWRQLAGEGASGRAATRTALEV
jgi:predicted dehydrogenase